VPFGTRDPSKRTRARHHGNRPGSKARPAMPTAMPRPPTTNPIKPSHEENHQASQGHHHSPSRGQRDQNERRQVARGAVVSRTRRDTPLPHMPPIHHPPRPLPSHACRPIFAGSFPGRAASQSSTSRCHDAADAVAELAAGVSSQALTWRRYGQCRGARRPSRGCQERQRRRRRRQPRAW
jgi:hypothetical protein